MLIKPQPNQVELEKSIERVLKELNNHSANTDEHSKIMTQLEKLYTIQASNRPYRVSADTLALVISNLAGIVLIVSYEHAHVATSKALNLLLKAR